MIHYLTGDATRPSRPEGTGARIICHVCNDIGAWGAGFVLALSRRWKEPELAYREIDLTLGKADLVPVETHVYVANMIAQRSVRSRENPVPLSYDALRSTLRWTRSMGDLIPKWEKNAGIGPTTYHMPRIGCGLAGGEWSRVEAILADVMGDCDVYVYDLPEKK